MRRPGGGGAGGVACGLNKRSEKAGEDAVSRQAEGTCSSVMRDQGWMKVETRLI